MKEYRQTIKMMVDNIVSEIERIDNVEIPALEKIVEGGRKNNDKKCEEHFYQKSLEEISIRDRLISTLHDFIRDSKCDKVSAYIKKTLDKMDHYDWEKIDEVKFSYLEVLKHNQKVRLNNG